MDNRTIVKATRTILPITKTPTQTNGLKCPYCHSISIKKAGIDNNTQRYKCKKCSKNFRDTTASSILHIHKKHLIDSYIQCMQESMSLRKTAKTIGISLGTAFAWRHKFLSTKTAQSRKHPQIFAEIIDLPYSTKGSRKLESTISIKQRSLILTTPGGEVSVFILKSKSHKTEIHKSVMHLLTEDGMITTGRHRILTRAFKAVPQSKIRSEKHSEINHLTIWLETFRGVASKYLQHYWNWYMSLNESIWIEHLRCNFHAKMVI